MQAARIKTIDQISTKELNLSLVHCLEFLVFNKFEYKQDFVPWY